MNRKTIMAITGVLIIALMFTATIIIINNLNTEVANEKDKNKAWEQSYKSLSSESLNTCNDYEHTISNLEDKIDEQNTSIVNLTKQIDELKKDNNELRIQVDDYKKKEKEATTTEQATTETQVFETPQIYEEPQAYNAPTGGLTPTGGVYWNGDQKETYYNLPMDGVIAQAQNFGFYGEYWVRDDGVKMYGDYVILACNRDVHPMGSLVETSLGTGISLDTGGFASSNPYQVDIAVSW